jgi:hypothetical protein
MDGGWLDGIIHCCFWHGIIIRRLFVFGMAFTTDHLRDCKFGRGFLGIYSLFVSCLLSMFLDQFSWLVLAAPASCTILMIGHNAVRYVLHIHEPPIPAYLPSLKAVKAWNGCVFPPLRASSHYSPESKRQASKIPLRLQSSIWPSWILLDLDLDLELDSLPTPPFPIFCFVSFYSILNQ